MLVVQLECVVSQRETVVLQALERPLIGTYSVVDLQREPPVVTEYQTPLHSGAVFSTGTDKFCFTEFPIAYNIFVGIFAVAVALVAAGLAVKDWWKIERRRFVRYPVDVETALAVRRPSNERERSS